MSTLPVSLAAAALAGMLALASASGDALLAVGLALVQVIFAAGAVRVVAVAALRPAAWLSVVAGVGALVWTYVEGTPDLSAAVAVLGSTLVVAFVLQLGRRDDRAGLVTSIAVAVAVCALNVVAVMWLALRSAPDGAYSVGLALLGVAVVGLGEALPTSRATRRVLSVLVASVLAAALVMLVDRFAQAVPAVSAVVVTAFAGLLAAVALAAVDRLVDDATSEVPVAVGAPNAAGAGGRHASPAEVIEPADAQVEATVDPAAAVPLRLTVPVLLAAPAAYVLGRIFVG